MVSGGAVSSIEQEGRALVERLGGRWTATGGLCLCPAHDDRSPSLSIRPGRSRLLLHCFAGCDSADILRALASERLIAPGAPVESTPRSTGSDPAANQAAAIRVWGGAREIAGTMGDHYLAGRALEACSPELRFHPRAPHGPRPVTRFRPALVAAVRDDVGIVAVHRTFLERRGSRVITLPEGKRGLGPFGSGAVRLGGAAPRLGLAEGIETALSASALFGLPCWATLGTERFALVGLPAEVTELLLFLDNDAGGRRAEALARETFAHIPSIGIHYPPDAGADWNDVLRAALRRGRSR